MMRRNRRASLWAIAYVSSHTLAIAQPTAVAPVTNTPQTASAPSAVVRPVPVPDAALDERRTDERVITLSAQQAVARALDLNPSLRGSEFQEQAAAQQVRAEEGRYPYSLIGEGGFTVSESPQLRADNSVAASVGRSVDATVGLRRMFPSGGVAEVTATEQYFDSDVGAVTVSPFVPASAGHAATLRAAMTQPFARGFGTTVGEAELRAARINRDAAGQALLRTRSALARDVLGAYYELWYAAKALEIDRASLTLAREQERQANERVEVGALALAETLAFQTRSAELEESVISSALGLRQRSITLAQLMGQISVEAVRYVPSSDPELTSTLPPVTVIESAVAAGSIEIAELEAQVRSAEVRAEVAGDAARPRVDGSAYVQTDGISERLPNAWQRALGLDWWSAHVGISVELPLTGSRQEALFAEAQLSVRAARAQLIAARHQIMAEARVAWETARAARERLLSAERTLVIAERAYEAAAARFELGQTAAITLQQAEEDLRRTRLRVVRAQVEIAQEQAQLEHLSGVLLKRYAQTPD